MEKTSDGSDPRRSGGSHFDRRGTTYDANEVHHRVVSILLRDAGIRAGCRILDVATGTGLLALEAARRAGPDGKVLGVDLSEGMLAEARRKAAAVAPADVAFARADAERLALPRESFDHVFCASALVLMSDIPGALRHWRGLLKPGGLMAFDTPSRPFGVSQLIADIAAEHGVHLAYADVADTPDKCRALLEDAGFEVVSIRTELADCTPMETGKAIAFWDDHLDHPAWRALRSARPTTRDAIRAAYVDHVTANGATGYVANDVALNFGVGRKPTPASAVSGDLRLFRHRGDPSRAADRPNEDWTREHD